MTEAELLYKTRADNLQFAIRQFLEAVPDFEWKDAKVIDHLDKSGPIAVNGHFEPTAVMISTFDIYLLEQYLLGRAVRFGEPLDSYGSNSIDSVRPDPKSVTFAEVVDRKSPLYGVQECKAISPSPTLKMRKSSLKKVIR